MEVSERGRPRPLPVKTSAGDPGTGGTLLQTRALYAAVLTWRGGQDWLGGSS